MEKSNYLFRFNKKTNYYFLNKNLKKYIFKILKKCLLKYPKH